MQAKTVDEAWRLAESIQGWLSRAEAVALYNAALNTPAAARIVEIGAFRGRSTALLAASGRQVVTIDPLVPGPTEDDYAVSEADAAALGELVSGLADVEWIRDEAARVNYAGGAIDLLYIDGDHRAGAPLADFRAFERHLAPGALVAFHDYGDRPAVGAAVGELEREGTLSCVAAAGLMYVGRVVRGEPKLARVFVARPYYDRIEPESFDSEQKLAFAQDRLVMRIRRHRSSLLAHNFNECVVQCFNTGGFDWFAMLHADLAAEERWLARMVDIAESRRFDVLHAVAPIKNGEGLSSTALAYSADVWDEVRRLTMTELARQPLTFGLDDARLALGDEAAVALLPNTGCLLVRTHVLEDFPGFAVLTRIVRRGERREAQVVPEDWNFGFWCAERGFSVGATREVKLQHFGRQAFPNDDVWGMPVDRNWEQHRRAA